MKRFRTHLLLLLALTLLLTACSKPATNPTPSEPVSLGKGAVAMVNGKPVTDQEFAQRVKVYELFGHDMSNAQAKNMYLDRYINEVLLLEEAAKRGITVPDQEAAKQVTELNNSVSANGGAAKLAEIKKNKGVVDADIQKAIWAELVINGLIDQLEGSIQVSDAEIQSYYDQNRAIEFTVKEDQVRASHILVADEAKAKELHGRIKGGEDFAKLAQEFSSDGSAARGGDLGYFGKGAMVKPFEDATFALKQVNDVSEPVQSQFGWHLIKLTGRRAPGVVPLAEVKSSIDAQLKSEKMDAVIEDLVKDLRSKATVEVVEIK